MAWEAGARKGLPGETQLAAPTSLPPPRTLRAPPALLPAPSRRVVPEVPSRLPSRSAFENAHGVSSFAMNIVSRALDLRKCQSFHFSYQISPEVVSH